MSHCVIALKDIDHYVASVCHCEDLSQVWSLIRETFYLPDAALALISLGDTNMSANDEFTSYHKDWGYSWEQCCPVAFETEKLLVSHSESIEADCLFVFERGVWARRWTMATVPSSPVKPTPQNI